MINPGYNKLVCPGCIKIKLHALNASPSNRYEIRLPNLLETNVLRVPILRGLTPILSS